MNRHIATLIAAALIVSAAGCGESLNSSFVYSEQTKSLMREAQKGFPAEGEVKALPGARQLIDERFGDPQSLKAWSKLPVDFGGVTGRVVETPDSSIAIKELILEFDTDVVVEEGTPLSIQFVTGSAAKGAGGPTVVDIESWSAEKGKASLSAAMSPEAAPVAGDVVVLDGGGVLQHGRGLYMRHCSHCHGTSGDGNGPTAQYLVPRPRDYRQGVFKFTSTNDQAKISRDDLHRVLKNGIPGTYMPSFVPMLNEDDKHAVVEYVRFLAMRGEFEKKIGVELSPDFSKAAVTARIEGGESKPEIVESLREFLAEDMADSLEFVSDDLETAWTTADTDGAVITPDMSRVPDSPESRRLGRELYLSKGINCADCHGIAGKGDGPQTTIFEKNPVTQQLYDTPGLHDVWDNVNQPRNLTRGIYRGGRRPIDLFRRIHAGIKGSRMPSFKIVPHEQIWHIVNYVLSIPFEVEPGHAPVVNASAEATPQASL
ncbi:MAG: c-type cytochrome [Fuerstiella sp.]|nr:c-type cytochrome [Fuerstiella sp.]